MLAQIRNHITQDPKISTKLGALGLGFGAISVVFTYLYPTLFWVSGIFNILAFMTFGCMGITVAVRQEISGLFVIRGMSARLFGIVIAISCFIMAIAMLAITLLALTALNPPG